MRLSRSVLFTLCLLAVVLILAYLTLGLSPTSRLVPLLVVVPLIGLLLVELKRGVGGADAEEAGAVEAGVEETDTGGRSERGVLLWVLALPALVQTLGILAGPGLFLLLYSRLRSREPWVFALTVAALTTLGLWGLFGLLLETSGGVGIPLLQGR
jgi:hypothetical protein